MKHHIQVDMFEVQLGAAILLQFRVAKDVVRVLADAGVHASGYTPDHVHGKLRELFEEQTVEHPRIDLIIGTHYDADHLEGLVPILEDQSIAVGQLWLPPVANDTDGFAADTAVEDYQLLTAQFASDNHREALRRYIERKREEITELSEIAGHADRETARYLGQDIERDQAAADQIRTTRDANYIGDDLAHEVGILRQELRDLVLSLGDEEPHGGAPIESDIDEAIEQERLIATSDRRALTKLQHLEPFERIRIAQAQLDSAPALAAARRRSLLHIRKSAVKDAINATVLHNVVQAAKARGLTAQTEIIRDGTPRRFVWKSTVRRFVGAQRSNASPALTLLGPSESLVKKHRDRLPRGTYLSKALFYSGEIKSITPSNQLSYVARIEHEGQGILISGDAGFVDFRQGRGPYFPALLKDLMPLHVVQVAHHGGRNGHFYRVLEDAGMSEQTEHAYFLLSHATHDKYRPSFEFQQFIGYLRKDDDDFSVLFTAQPKPEKVLDFQDIVSPATEAPADRGDVRLIFAKGSWKIKRHAIEV